MGQGSSSGLSVQDLDGIRESSHYTVKEINEWHHKFYKQFPSGAITRSQFIHMYTQMFPAASGKDARELAEHIFRAYDIDHNGLVDFHEFMCTMSVSAKGTPEEKLAWAFKLYDRDGDGYISRREATDIVRAILKMQGQTQIREKTQDTVAELFVRLDENRDTRLSLEEFSQAANRSGSIMDILSTSQ